MLEVSITRIFTFDSAHYLPHHRGKCKELHGHTYKLEVTVSGTVDPGPGSETGMVMDFGRLDKLVKDRIVNVLDHTNLNDTFDNPTAEVMVRWSWDKLWSVLHKDPRVRNLEKVRLWETPNSYAEVDR